MSSSKPPNLLGSLKRRKAGLVTLAVVAAVYFGAWSTLETQFFLKSLAILLPVQLGGTLYFLYLYWKGKIPGTARHQAKQATETTRNRFSLKKSDF